MTPVTSASLPGPDTIVTATLSNGLRALVYENFASQTVVIAGYAPGGSIAERPEQTGLAHFVATMLRRGAGDRSFDEINELIEGVGASFGFGAGRHSLSFGGKSLDEDVDLVLALLAESLQQPTFPPEQVEQVRSRILTSIQERRNSTRSTASLLFRRHLYPPDHPYGRPISGEEESVRGFGRRDLLDFYRKAVSPQEGAVVVVGAIRAQEALEKLERTLGQWRQPLARPVMTIPPRPTLRHSIEIAETIPGKSQSDLVLGWPGIARADADYFPVMLCNTILGQFGMGGRLGRRIREQQGMAYYAYSAFGANRGAGSWRAVAGVNPENVPAAVAAILAEVRRITAEPVAAAELADVKANRTGSLPMRLETNDGIADSLLEMIWYDLGLDYLRRYADRVRAVTGEDILRVARTYLDPDRYVLAIAGPSTPPLKAHADRR